jgi:hypothetical protein
MGFNDLSTNQGVSGTNLQSAVDLGIISLNYGQTIGRSSQLVTNSYAAAKTNFSGSNKASNQILVKGDIGSSGSQRIIAGSYDAAQFPSTQSLQWTQYDSSWTVAYPSGQWQHLEASPNGRSWIGASNGTTIAWGDITASSVGTQSVSYYGFVADVGLSDNGTHLYGLDGGLGGSLYMSHDGGSSWTTIAGTSSSYYYSAMGCSGNGAYVAMFRQANDIYSTGSALVFNGNYGADGYWEFTVPSFLSYTTANACSISYNGHYAVVAAGDGQYGQNYIWVNNNYFWYASWSGTALSYTPDLTAISGDGRCMIVGKYGSATVYTSTNYGASWSSSVPRYGSYGVADVSVSQNGGLFAIIGGDGQASDSFCTSIDGVNWSPAYNPSAYVYDYGSTLWSVIAQ